MAQSLFFFSFSSSFFSCSMEEKMFVSFLKTNWIGLGKKMDCVHFSLCYAVDQLAEQNGCTAKKKVTPDRISRVQNSAMQRNASSSIPFPTPSCHTAHIFIPRVCVQRFFFLLTTLRRRGRMVNPPLSQLEPLRRKERKECREKCLPRSQWRFTMGASF